MALNSITRTLCQKYTNLTDDEITHLEEYATMLQPLANAEQADVFIDCRSFTGKTAIVVAEAKPQTVPSNYSIPILGMLINWQDEPAVDRTFRFEKPTRRMCAVHMPEDRNVIQTVEPLFYDEKLIAVLIFEKKADIEEKRAQTELVAEEEKSDAVASVFGKLTKPIIEHLSEAVIIIGDNDEVVACNAAARELYAKKLGYVDNIMKMSLKNIQTDSDEYFLPGSDISEKGIKQREVMVSSYNLRYTTVPIYENSIKLAIIIEDVTALREQEKKAGAQTIAMREQRHRIKNSLVMLSGMLDCQEKYADELDARSVLHDTAGRLNALAATLEEIVHVSDKSASLKYVLEKVRANILQSSISTMQPVSIKIVADDIQISSAYASPIALVVNELLQNAIKHAFPSGRNGTVMLTAEKGILSTKISVIDDGIGFEPEQERKNGTGLDIVKTIVKEKLNGEFMIESSEKGTAVTFDFIE
ncbi:MAG: sensor histidine kinase [Oscillospiraceae bacterium]